MATSATIPMLSPNGQSGEVPADQVSAAEAKGFKRAVSMTAPNGTTGYIPVDKQQDAINAGFKPVATQHVTEELGFTTPHPDDGPIMHFIRGSAEGIKHMIPTSFQDVELPSLAATPPPIAMGKSAQMARDAYVKGVREQQEKIKGIEDFAKENPAYFAGEVVAPIAVGAAIGRVIPKTSVIPAESRASGLPERLYGSALKPSTTISPSERAGAIRAGLENEIPVSEEGVNDLHKLIENLNGRIKEVIASDPTRKVDPQAVASRVDQIKPRMAAQVNAAEDLATADAAKKQFLREQGAKKGRPAIAPRPTGLLDASGQPIMDAGTSAVPSSPAPPMSAAAAQEMKQGTYQALGKKSYGELKGASVEAQKALARGLKEEISRQFPEIGSLNEQESRLLDLQPILEKAVNRAANHDVLGIGTPLASAAGTAVTGSAPLGIVAGILKQTIDNPLVKSRLAITLSKSAKIPYSKALARVAEYSASLGRASHTTLDSSDDQ